MLIIVIRGLFMSNYDHNVISRNISMLIKNSGISQKQLGDAIGMSQPNLSKALNENDKRVFTVEQIYKIAEYFDVSTDSIMGFNPDYSQKTSLRSIASFIATLIEDDIALVTETTVREKVYMQPSFNEHALYSSTEFMGVSYQAIYFPNHWDPAEVKCASFEDAQALYSEAEQCGNETRYTYLNNFLKKFLDILKVYKSGQISEEAYRIVVKDYLNQLGDR